MLKAVLIRTTLLLTEIEATPVSGTAFNATEDIPPDIQDSDGYIAFMTNPAHTQEFTGNKQRMNTITFPGLLVGRQVLTGNSFTDRCNLLEYADLIAGKFNERVLLQNSSWQPLAVSGVGAVVESAFVNGRVFEGPYPMGQSDIIRRQYSFSLQIQFDRLVMTHR